MIDVAPKPLTANAPEVERTLIGPFRAICVAAAAMLATVVPAMATTLEELMDACVQVLEEGNFTGVAPYGVLRLEEGIMGSAQRIDGGVVTLYVQNDLRDDTIHACNVLGYTWGDKATIATSGVTWADAEARIGTWFAARAQFPGHVDISKVSIGTPYIVAVCHGTGEGFLIQGGPAYIGSEANDIPEHDWPFAVSATQVADREQACEFYNTYGPGG